MPETFDVDGYAEAREAYMARLAADMEDEPCTWGDDCDY